MMQSTSWCPSSCGDLLGVLSSNFAIFQSTRRSPPPRWKITIVISVFFREMITTPMILKGKTFIPVGVTSHYPQGNFIFILNRIREIFANASKCQQSRKFSLFNPKRSPHIFWVFFIILHLQSNAIENARIDTIYTTYAVDRIYCVNQYEDI